MYDSYFKCLWSGCLEWTMPNIKNAIIQGSDIEGEGYFEAILHFYEQYCRFLFQSLSQQVLEFLIKLVSMTYRLYRSQLV